MKPKLTILITAIWLLNIPFELNSQGYIVPNGVSYVGLNFGGGYQIDVIRDPTNSYTTGFYFTPKGRTLPTVYTNTFQFAAIVDVGVRVFFVSSNQPISQAAIQSGSYTELMYPSSYVFNNNSPFYVGLYTGNQSFAPPDGIYSDPLFGWARLVNNQGVIQLLDSALVYKAGGIYAGTTTIIPEPSTFTLAAAGLLLLCSRRLNRFLT